MEELSRKDRELLRTLSNLRQENYQLEHLNESLLERISILNKKIEKLREERRCNMWLRHLAIQWRVTQEEAIKRIFATNH